jgi:glycosyltransferase involved in cell wall biosynthesis
MPESGAFVAALFRNFEKLGAEVRVIAPWSAFRRLLSAWRGRIAGGQSLSAPGIVVRPQFLSIAHPRSPYNMFCNRFNAGGYRRAVHRAFDDLSPGCDFAYAHFWAAGHACIEPCESRGLPCVVAIGESSLAGYYDRVWGEGIFGRTLARFAGVIAVSQENEAICRDACPRLEDRLIYVPNAVDTVLFSPGDKTDARRRLSLPTDGRIALFCGHLNERKGPLRVQKALDQLGDVLGVYLGRGPQRPQGQGVLHVGAVPHAELPIWLRAADIFVLPSLGEGMSNAILEALAAGLPVAVSDRPFNRAFLDDDSATFFDPLSPAHMAQAIGRLLEDGARRDRQTTAGLAVARRQTLAGRAERILKFALRVSMDKRAAHLVSTK